MYLLQLNGHQWHSSLLFKILIDRPELDSSSRPHRCLHIYLFPINIPNMKNDIIEYTHRCWMNVKKQPSWIEIILSTVSEICVTIECVFTKV